MHKKSTEKRGFDVGNCILKLKIVVFSNTTGSQTQTQLTNSEVKMCLFPFFFFLLEIHMKSIAQNGIRAITSFGFGYVGPPLQAECFGRWKIVDPGVNTMEELFWVEQ
jgi:hypothetical protein